MKKFTVKTAIAEIINFQTLPPQIDYISPAERQKYQNANAYLETLCNATQKRAAAKINKEINHYFSDEGAYQYDCLF